MHTQTVAHDTELIILQRGELVIKTLTELVTERGIVNASFSGLGAVEALSCGYYDLTTRSYHFTQYNEVYEVVQMAGNVMLKNDRPFIHLHGVFTDTQNLAFGGHVEEMRVAVTLEIVMHIFSTTRKRQYDDETGLFLISPQQLP